MWDLRDSLLSSRASLGIEIALGDPRFIFLESRGLSRRLEAVWPCHCCLVYGISFDQWATSTLRWEHTTLTWFAIIVANHLRLVLIQLRWFVDTERCLLILHLNLFIMVLYIYRLSCGQLLLPRNIGFFGFDIISGAPQAIKWAFHGGVHGFIKARLLCVILNDQHFVVSRNHLLVCAAHRFFWAQGTCWAYLFDFFWVHTASRATFLARFYDSFHLGCPVTFAIQWGNVWHSFGAQRYRPWFNILLLLEVWTFWGWQNRALDSLVLIYFRTFLLILHRFRLRWSAMRLLSQSQVGALRFTGHFSGSWLRHHIKDRLTTHGIQL